LGVTSKIFSFDPPFEELKFPLSYQDSWNVTSNVKGFGLAPGSTITEKIDAIVDGYGTVILPGSTSNCLRLKLKITATVNFSGLTFESSEYSFLWITSNGVSAVIDADSNQMATSTSSASNPSPQPTSFRSQGTSSVSNNSLSSDGLSDIYLSQNPTSSEMKLSFSMKSSGNVQISLMDVLGREVHILQNGRASAGQNIIPIDLSKFSAGSYFVRVTAEGMALTRKLIITK
jgi:hypothetical protein